MGGLGRRGGINGGRCDRNRRVIGLVYLIAEAQLRRLFRCSRLHTQSRFHRWSWGWRQLRTRIQRWLNDLGRGGERLGVRRHVDVFNLRNGDSWLFLWALSLFLGCSRIIFTNHFLNFNWRRAVAMQGWWFYRIVSRTASRRNWGGRWRKCRSRGCGAIPAFQ